MIQICDLPQNAKQRLSTLMATRKAQLPNFDLLVIFSLLLLLSPLPTGFAKSRRPINEMEIRQKKNQCYTDIDSGLWGWNCKSSTTAKENCALRCLSRECYEIIYQNDPLEEGEKDLVRGQEFKYCMHKVSLGESLDNIRSSFNY